MKLTLFLLVFVASCGFGYAAPPPQYEDNDLLYEKAMNMLQQQIQLLRNFVNEINREESLKNSGPVWQGISNVFTDLSGMFGGGGNRHYQYESYGTFPPQMNATEMARKARIRMEQTRKDIIELNSRISQIIDDAFGPRPYGKDYHHDKNREAEKRQHDEKDDQANNEELQTKAIEITTQKPLSEADETKFPVANGYLGFELPIRGSISQELLKDQLYQEEYEAIGKMSPREVGKILKPLISKGQINANMGQCRVSKLLDDEKPLTIDQ